MIYIIRHGQTELNQRQVLQGRSDFLLNDAGIRQAQQPGYLRGYSSSKWNWLSAVLDGTIPFEDICRWINMSYEATKAKPGNKKTPLPKREISE